MRRGLKDLAAGIAVLAALASPALAHACAPEKLVRMVVRNTTPGLSAVDQAAQPLTIWRLGSRFLRTEEQPDPARAGSQKLTIIAEPDVWAINLADRTGRHQVDPGPDLTAHAPILPLTGDTPPQFMALEFGCEAGFVAAFAPKPERTTRWGEITAGLHVLRAGEHGLVILMDTRRAEPLLITQVKGDQVLFMVRYDAYRAGLPERPELFMPPAKTTITEGSSSAPALPPAR